MKTIRILTYTSVALLLSACVSCIPSINPFYFERDVVFDARLLGEWQPKEPSKESAVWKFEAEKEKAYKITISEKEGKQGQFNGRLFKLKGGYFIDLLPADCDYATNQIDMVGAAMFPGHLLARVPQLEPELKLAFFDFEWLEKYLDKNQNKLAFHKEEKHLLLTAGTRDLQSFVVKHLGEGELFQKPDAYVPKAN